MYLDMESGSDGAKITTNLLNAATHGNAGYWGLVPENASFLSSLEVSSLYEENVGTIIAGGTSYTDHGYRTFAFRNVTHPQFARYTFTEFKSKVSLGCYLRLGGFTGSTYGSYDLIAMEGNDGDFAVMNFQDFPGDEFLWEVHTHQGVGGPIRIAANKTYWVTMLWDKPDRKATLKVYDPMTWRLLGTSSLELGDEFCEAVCFGRYDDHNYTPSTPHYYDDLMVDLTHATFPLLPALGKQSIGLETIGPGTISGATNHELLDVGKAYALTAKPAPGNLFAGWSGSVTSAATKLHIIMASNLTLTATFVSNYVQYVKGTYNGLLYNSADPQQASSGYVTLTVNNVGSYTGKLMRNAKSYSFHGVLAPDSGTAELLIPRPGTNALRMRLALDLTNQTDQVVGSVSEETADATEVWKADLALDRATFNSLNPAPNAGRYTLYFSPETGAGAGPKGGSVGTLILSPAGSLTATLALADGTKATQKTTLSKGGHWPLYVALYKGKGALLSSAQLDTNQQNTDLSGALVWFKQTQVSKFYPDGFTNATTLLGSRYVAPAPFQPALNSTSAVVSFSNPQLAQDFTNEVLLSPQGGIVNQSTNKLSVSLSKSTGLFQGSVTPPTGGKPLTLKGVLFQKQNLGAGYVMGTNQSGVMLLTPEGP